MDKKTRFLAETLRPGADTLYLAYPGGNAKRGMRYEGGLGCKTNNCWRLTFQRQQRAERVQQSKMVCLNRQRLFRCHRQRLRCHGERKVANNGANGMLMPVVDGEVRTACGFQQGKAAEIDRAGVIVIAGRFACWLSGFCIAGKCRQTKTRRDHP